MNFEPIWIVWLITVLASFGIIEGATLVNKQKGDTLSENTRKWIGLLSQDTKKRAAGAAVFAGTALGLVVWFVLHIFGL